MRERPVQRQHPSGLPIEHVLLPSIEIRSRVGVAATAVITGLRPLPEPENDSQKVQYDAIAICRQAARIAVRVNSIDDLESAAIDLAGLTKDMKQVVARADSLSPGSESFEGGMRYFMFDTSASHHVREIRRIQESRFGKENSLIRAINELMAEQQNFHIAIIR